MENKIRNELYCMKLILMVFMPENHSRNIRKSGEKIRKYQKIFIIEKGNLDFRYGSTVLIVHTIV